MFFLLLNQNHVFFFNFFLKLLDHKNPFFDSIITYWIVLSPILIYSLANIFWSGLRMMLILCFPCFVWSTPVFLISQFRSLLSFWLVFLLNFFFDMLGFFPIFFWILFNVFLNDRCISHWLSLYVVHDKFSWLIFVIV